MLKKPILIILAITFLAHANVLLNKYVGDDEIVIVKNTFYRTLANVPRLFSKEYLTQDVDIFLDTREDKNSGSIAYRPVLSLTYFIDYRLWELNPFGYHLTNLLLHVLNVYLLYLLILTIIKNSKTAMLAALLFAVHPIHSEAVSNIGYRADVLSTFFVLLSFLSFVRYRNSQKKDKEAELIYSCAFFFLAVFTKESAIVLPAFVLIYDWFFKERSFKRMLKNIQVKYLGYFYVMGFYLALYFFVFRNPTLNVPQLIGANVGVHFLTMAEIFLRYFANFILPFTVNVLPPQYAPPLDSFVVLRTLGAVIVIVLMGTCIFKTYRKEKTISFFLLWFLIAYVPVSNIIPIPNPMAHRFLYLPSVGLLTFFAIVIDKMCANPKNFTTIPRLAKMIPVAIISLCIVITIPLNRTWQSNYTVAAELIRNYPQHPQGYLIMGLGLFKSRLFDETKLVMDKALNLGLKDPRGYHILAVSYSDQPDVAKKHFETSIRYFPQYSLSYAGLGRLYTFEKKYIKALPYFKKSTELTPSYTGYGYMIQCLLLLKRDEEAKDVYQEAKAVIKDKGHLASLEKMIDLGRKLKEPIDIGL